MTPLNHRNYLLCTTFTNRANCGQQWPALGRFTGLGVLCQEPCLAPNDAIGPEKYSTTIWARFPLMGKRFWVCVFSTGDREARGHKPPGNRYGVIGRRLQRGSGMAGGRKDPSLPFRFAAGKSGRRERQRNNQRAYDGWHHLTLVTVARAVWPAGLSAI